MADPWVFGFAFPGECLYNWDERRRLITKVVASIISHRMTAYFS
jgi:hypothetical protein